MLVAGKLGLQTQQMAVGSLIAISGGLLVAAPTAITGLLDWLEHPQGHSAHACDRPPAHHGHGNGALRPGLAHEKRPGYNTRRSARLPSFSASSPRPRWPPGFHGRHARVRLRQAGPQAARHPCPRCPDPGTLRAGNAAGSPVRQPRGAVAGDQGREPTSEISASWERRYLGSLGWEPNGRQLKPGCPISQASIAGERACTFGFGSSRLHQACSLGDPGGATAAGDVRTYRRR